MSSLLLHYSPNAVRILAVFFLKDLLEYTDSSREVAKNINY